MFKISSAEQSKKAHSLDKVAREGWILPDIYWLTVGLLTPSAVAICVLVFPEKRISFLIFSDILADKSAQSSVSIKKLY
jgi:hypothetical protein